MSKAIGRKVMFVRSCNHEPPKLNGKRLPEGKVGVLVRVLSDASVFDVEVKFSRNKTEYFHLNELRYLNNKEVVL